MLPPTSRLQVFYISYLSNPACDRPIYRAICRQKVRRILELGIGVGQRAARMIQVAAHFAPIEEIQYVGMDLFEGRSAQDGPGVTLKMAHRLLGGTGAGIRLVPGDPLSGLSRVANSLGQFDLMVISSRLDRRRLAGVWYYVPRLLHEKSLVLLQRHLPGGRRSLRPMTPSEIDVLATSAVTRRAA